MRKLNLKNKLFIFIFSIIVLGIVFILIESVKLSKKEDDNESIYTVSTNSVIYAEDSSLVDTSSGGEIKKHWNNDYYFVSNDNKNIDIGLKSIVYEKAVEKVYIFGENYNVSSDGDLIKNTDKTEISNTNNTSFYKIKDRQYLIISNEIYNEDKTIYTNRYLIVTLDKQGNASLLNDAINVKTINPLKLLFDNYIFDIANERLIVNEKAIDLKLIDGSTNEYVEDTEEHVEEADMTEFITAYNKLVNDFKKYVDNENLKSSSKNQVVNNTVITNATNTTNNIIIPTQADNKTNITKRVSLRGTVSYPTYIDVTYVVTDPEDKYQAVYLLVTGRRNGEMVSEKIMLDKYDTKYRISNLEMKSEYSISLGYVEVTTNNKTVELYDNIEDVINVRTTNCDAKITIEKIALGNVYFKFKMSKEYAIESGKIVLYSNNEAGEHILINYKDAISEKGFSGKLKLEESTIYELRLEDAVYNGKNVDIDVKNRFVYHPLGVSE